jgi:UDPglucose--hexose-1-phosphate uridylyltransferase
VELRGERFVAEILDPREGFEPRRSEVEIRRDPLTGRSCRLLPPGCFPAPKHLDLEQLARRSRESCPFCGDRIERLTPRLPPAVWPEGRIRRGQAVLFPNLVPYSRWSSVSIYSADRHLLPIGSMTPTLIADNLATQVAYIRAVRSHDPGSAWASVNANHFPPSGSSIPHPHLQGSVNPEPTTVQRRLAGLPEGTLDEYRIAERRGERWIGSTGRVEWMAAFAPAGPAELRAFVPGVSCPSGLDDEAVAELARGLSLALALYDRLGFQSFNLACYGLGAGPHDGPVLVRSVARVRYGPQGRSDVMWSEALHEEAATDLWPEAVAERARALFRSA